MVVTILLLISSSVIYSQVLIKFNPMELGDDFSFPALQGGIEYKLSGRLTMDNELGIKYRKSEFEISDTSFIGSKGFKLRSELRYYFKRKQKETFNGLYAAANIFLTGIRIILKYDISLTGTAQ